MCTTTSIIPAFSLLTLPPEVVLEVSKYLPSEQLYLLFEIAMSCSAEGLRNANLLRCRRIVMLDVVQREDENSLKQSLEKPGNFFDRFSLLIKVASSTEKAIRTLNFSSYALSDENVTQISVLCPQLNKLVIGNQEKGSLSRGCFEKLPQNLETLILNGIAFKAKDLLKLPPNLKHLSFQNCSLVSGNFSEVSSPNCMLLEDLEELSWNQGNEELFLFFYGHKKLHTLTFLSPKNFQYEITEEWLKKFPSLKQLTTQLDLIDKGIWQSISPSLIETFIIHSEVYNGRIYEGKRHGQGINYHSDGTKQHEGFWQDDQPHGQGTSYRSDGTKAYEGQWQNGKPYGEGISYYLNGTKAYEGQWKANQWHDQGTSYRSDGTKEYEGQWQTNQWHGQGTSYRSDGIKIYEGQWQNDKAHGQGVVYRPDGTKKYKGQLQDNVRHGYGKLYRSDGSKVYKGFWQDDKACGYGISYYPDGTKSYEGQWQDSIRHGYGRIYRSDGTKVYEGQWQNNLPHGQGISYHFDETKEYEGLWQNGSFQNQISFATIFRGFLNRKNLFSIFDSIFNFFKVIFAQMSNWFSQNRNS